MCYERSTLCCCRQDFDAAAIASDDEDYYEEDEEDDELQKELEKLYATLRTNVPSKLSSSLPFHM